MCLADAIHNFKWVKIIQIWQNGGQLFSNRADWCHIMASTCLKGGSGCGNNWVKTPIYSAPAVKGLMSKNKFISLVQWYVISGLNIYMFISWSNSYNAEIFSYKPWRPKGFFQFKIIINVLVISFRFIWIPVLWVYGHYKYFYSYSAGIDFRRQILTSKVDPRTERVKI